LHSFFGGFDARQAEPEIAVVDAGTDALDFELRQQRLAGPGFVRFFVAVTEEDVGAERIVGRRWLPAS
jgi:hypothetical protein